MPKILSRPKHLILRHQTYYALMTIPKDVQHYFGKTRFSKTTETSDIKIALTKADIFVIQWKAEIAKARERSDDPIIDSAMELRKMMGVSPRELFLDVVESETDQLRNKVGDFKADLFESLATNKDQLLTEYLKDWEKRQHAKGLVAKTVDQMKSDLSLLTNYIITTKALTPKHCDIWIHEIARDGNLSSASVNRIIGSCKNFYRFLQEIRVFPEDSAMPFKVPMAYRRSRKKNAKEENKKEKWKPLSKSQLDRIYQATQAKGDKDLVDLIYIAAHSGARIEEICSLKIEQINLQDLSFYIDDSKTEAGFRTVPIHSKVINLIERLISQSGNAYLFEKLTSNKYNDRSNAIGKRFGQLKTKLGFGRLHVFHSIRKTFTTELERAGIPENVAADIVGHEKQTMTYGVYSQGTSLEQMKEAVEKVHYPFTE
jgi:integrase